MKVTQIDTSYILFPHKMDGKVKVLLFVLILQGFYFLSFRFAIIPIFISLIGVVFLLRKRLSLLDLQNKQFSKSWILHNNVYNNWKPLPEISYISVFKATLVSRAQSMSNRQSKISMKMIQINLIYDKTQKITVYQTTDAKEALQIANHISQELAIPIYDATCRNGVWL